MKERERKKKRKKKKWIVRSSLFILEIENVGQVSRDHTALLNEREHLEPAYAQGKRMYIRITTPVPTRLP